MLRHAPLLLLALSACNCCEPDDAPDAGRAAWTDLTSLEHWRGYQQDSVPESWVMDDGAIHLEEPGGVDLITREQYGSFELELEWRISPRGNSGIMYHVAETDGPSYMTGPEMQVLDNAVAGGDRLHSAGADYALYAPEEDDTRPVGEWNRARIRVDGPHVTYWLGGVEQVSYELWSEDWERRVASSKFAGWPDFGRHETGHIALQDHGDPVWYRNIRIRRL